MHTSAKIAIIIVAVLAVTIVVLESGLIYVDPAPLEERVATASYTPKDNVVIDATTFNGDIQIQPTSGNQIEVSYNIKAPHGHLYDIQINNNETKTDNTTKLITSAKNQVDPAATNYIADLTLKLPTNSQYNLTLVTFNGNVIQPQLKCAKEAVSTMNGDITITSGSQGTLTATCMNGNIKVSLPDNAQFSVVASVGNGKITHQGINLDASTDSATRLEGATVGGEGDLNVQLVTGSGNITLQYLP